MNDLEYANLARVEGVHWYYRGKRRIVRDWLQRLKPTESGEVLLDVGCGTGIFLKEWNRGPGFGVDHASQALSFRAKDLANRLIRGRSDVLPVASGTIDIVTALDVLEHLDDDRGGLEEIYRVMKPGAIGVLTVPALPCLWSDWDVALHHRRRYTRRSLLETVPSQFTILRCAYFNEVALPVVALLRIVRRWRRGGPRAEDKIPPDPLNSLFEWIMVRLACRPSYQPRWGVSLLLILKKTAS